MSEDGRIVCPWHGGERPLSALVHVSHITKACFNACTGDIEDSPGLDSLWSYAATIRDGKIVVKADQKEVESKVGRVAAKCKPAKSAEKESVVIVGGGAGAIHTIESLRMVCDSHFALDQSYEWQNGFDGEIICFSEEKYTPIDRSAVGFS